MTDEGSGAAASDPAADDAAGLEAVLAALERARGRLAADGARTEGVGSYEPARRRLRLFTVEERIVPTGRCWRLGTLLVGDDGSLAAVGSTTRAKRRERVGYVAESARRRDELRDAAARGGFEPGDVVNFDVLPIPLEPGWSAIAGSPLTIREGRPVVRWAAGAPIASAVPLDAYLDERIDLLEHPRGD